MPAEKLPVWANLKQSYSFLLNNLGVLARISAGWLVAIAGAFVVSTWLVTTAVQGDPGFAANYTALPVRDQAGLLIGLPLLILVVGIWALIITWHRIIVRGPDASRTVFPFPFGAMLLYFGRSNLIGAVLALAVFTSVAFAVSVRGPGVDPMLKAYAPGTVIIIGATIGFLLAGRLALVLPGGSVGDWAMNFGASWRATRGNSWRLAIGSLLSAGPLAVFNIMLNAALENADVFSRSPSALAVKLAALAVLAVFAALMEAGFLSFAYLHFTSSQGAKS